ncbi:MAG: hypothetical protein WCT26_04630 [Candidatus Buchananbacteria bacterium]|jgi:hypothetical protein
MNTYEVARNDIARDSLYSKAISNEGKTDQQAKDKLNAIDIVFESDGQFVIYRIVYQDETLGLERIVKGVDAEDQKALALAKSILMKKYHISSEQLV